MKVDNRRAFDKHLEGAAPQHFSPVYLIMGKDDYACKEATQALIQALLPDEKQREFSLVIVEGDGVSIQELLLEVNSASFLTNRRVIWLQQVDKLKKDGLEALSQALSLLPRSNYLIMTAPSILKTTTFYKNIEKAGVVLDLPEIKAWEKEKLGAEWVNKEVSALRKTIPYPACQLLVKQVGGDPALLKQELDKLLTYIGDRSSVTLQDVEAICTITPSETVWQLGEALFQRNAVTALHICRGLLSEGSPLLPLLRQIRSQFQTEYQICTLLAAGGDATAVAREYPYMKGSILERNINLAQGYGLERFKRGLLAIDATERQAKNSAIDEDLLAELLMIRLTT